MTAQTYYKLAFVRDPLKRFVSAYAEVPEGRTSLIESFLVSDYAEVTLEL